MTACTFLTNGKYKMSQWKWAPSSEFVSSSIPSWQISTAHAQPFRGARDLAFCQKVPLDSLLVWASSEGSGETARMRRLAWTFAARIGNKYQIRLTLSKWWLWWWWWILIYFVNAESSEVHSWRHRFWHSIVLPGERKSTQRKLSTLPCHMTMLGIKPCPQCGR